MSTETPVKPENGNGTMTAPQQPPAPVREILRVEDHGPLAHLFDTARFDQTQRIARVMATSSLLPKHLWGVEEKYNLIEATANCFRVCNQAIRWGFDPFAVMDETYVVQGRLGYQGKLVAAVVNTRCDLSTGLRYLFAGKKGDDGFACVCYASHDPITPDGRALLLKYLRDDDLDAINDLDELDIRAVRCSFGQCKTFNKDKTLKELWQKDPEQKLSYNAAIKWARRHAPEIVLGVLTDDDLDRLKDDLQRLPSADLTAAVAYKAPDQATVDRLRAATPTLPDGDSRGSQTVEAVTTTTTAPTEPTKETPEVKTAVTTEPTNAADLSDLRTSLAGTWKIDQLSPLLKSFYPMGTQSPPEAMNLLAAAEDRIEAFKHLTPQLADYLAKFERVKTPAGILKLVADAKASPDPWMPEQLSLIQAVASRRELEMKG